MYLLKCNKRILIYVDFTVVVFAFFMFHLNDHHYINFKGLSSLCV